MLKPLKEPQIISRRSKLLCECIEYLPSSFRDIADVMEKDGIIDITIDENTEGDMVIWECMRETEEEALIRYNVELREYSEWLDERLITIVEEAKELGLTITKGCEA